MNPEDQTVWMRITRFGNATLHFTETDALDWMTRTDRLYQARMVEWVEVVT